MKRGLHISLVIAFCIAILPWQSEAQQPATVNLTVLHYNDFHSQNVPRTISKRGKDGSRTKVEVGGAAVLKAYIDRYRLNQQNTVLLHAGDDFQGTPISSVTKGKSQIEILELIQPDAMTLGNHEFDYGANNVEALLPLATFPVISANLLNKSTGTPFVPRYRILDRRGLTVAVIGLAPPDLESLTMRKNVENIEILDASKSVEKTMNEVRQNFDTDVIIVLSHMGLDNDSLLAENVDGIDVIVGGHSHTPLFRPKIVNGTYIVQAGSKGRWLGKLDLGIDTAANTVATAYGRLIETDVSAVSPDPRMEAKVAELEKLVSEGLNEVIGYLKTDWRRGHGGQESNMGNWQCDVMVDFAKADIAFQNAGGIRKDLPAGPITLRDIWEVNPFGNEFVTFSVSGKRLREMLVFMERKGREYCHVGGLRYKYDDAEIGDGQLLVTVQGQALDPGRQYSVVTNNYLAGHLDKYFGISASEVEFDPVYPVAVDREVFIDYIRKQKTVESKTDGRSVIVNR